jgi:hypothetical protein
MTPSGSKLVVILGFSVITIARSLVAVAGVVALSVTLTVK